MLKLKVDVNPMSQASSQLTLTLQHDQTTVTKDAILNVSHEILRPLLLRVLSLDNVGDLILEAISGLLQAAIHPHGHDAP